MMRVGLVSKRTGPVYLQFLKPMGKSGLKYCSQDVKEIKTSLVNGNQKALVIRG